MANLKSDDPDVHVNPILDQENPLLLMPYREREEDEIIETQHHGQRKLLCSELALLLMIDTDKEYTVVYAGAAPGLHTPYLSEKFKNITFHLYDPRRFGIDPTNRIKLFKGLFTNDIALSYQYNENVIFISDIRSLTDEQTIWNEMQQQQKWCIIMKPQLASLKFRLPWIIPNAAGENQNILKGLDGKVNIIDGVVEYLNGDIHLPIWGCVSTTECRLVVDKNRHKYEIRDYDCKLYESQMSFFNRITRPSFYYQPCKIEKFNRNFDCASEVEILTQYVKKYMGQMDGQNRLSAVCQLSNEISIKLRKSVDKHCIQMPRDRNKTSYCNEPQYRICLKCLCPRHK
jgi:Poly A polymerase regulatory subunit